MVGNSREIGVDKIRGNSSDHECLKCEEPFGTGILLRFIGSIGHTSIECPVCYQVHYFDDIDSQKKSFLVAAAIAIISFIIAAIFVAFLIYLQSIILGWYFIIELVLPLIGGAIGGGIGLKIYHWRNKKLVRYGD